ncbi:MAG: oligosaccharide flippase family protein [Bacteroidales bacterium]|jgi:O-antigen/teichoic acid export membrane protein|nr:oligosaccharide flippase family protein [Bacteroidales bacterium]MDD2205229.1 oligosaccharide flippase family protein [Bacteroidales bacterium]MDD3151669.1 oligosaccharide flippase family protein [Bacteroidales bacterium]MDD3914680.1 oligosaccharide flippase family protein [Bacteroidales bacterium]MDD4633401.1 oligosaccharide flippase family protein [Bacteroidales bacterium]
MGVVARQSIKGSIVNYIGTGIGFITTFFVLTTTLTATEIGITRVLIEIATVFAGFAQLGTSSSIIKFYPYFKDEKSHDNGFFFWTLVIPFIGFLIYGFLFLLLKAPVESFFAKESPEFIPYYYFIFPLGFFMLYMAIFETNSNVLLRIVVPKFVREILVRVLTLASYLIYHCGIVNFYGFIIIFCSIYAVAAIIDLIYLLSFKRISLKPNFKVITKSLKREYLLYTSFLIVAALAGQITPAINTFFISNKMGLHFTGIYTIALFMASMIDIPYRSLGAISQPHLSQAMKDNDIKTANVLCKKVSLHQLIAGSFIFFAIWINVDLFFELLPNGDQYAPAKWVFFFLGLSRIYNSVLSIGTSVLAYSKYYYYSLIFTAILTVSAIFLNIKLIPLYGMEGAAIASLLAYVINYALLLGLVGFTIKTNPFSFNQVKVIIIILIMFLFNYLLVTFVKPMILSININSLVAKSIDAILRTSILSALGVITIYKLKISNEINTLIDRFIHLNRFIK